MLIVCQACRLNLSLDKMGVWILYRSSLNNEVTRVYRGDRYRCLKCSYSCITDVGNVMTRSSLGDVAFRNTVSAALAAPDHVEFTYD